VFYGKPVSMFTLSLSSRHVVGCGLLGELYQYIQFKHLVQSLFLQNK
jgi:hypothetical protein